MTKLRVLVVDDSPTLRDHISTILRADPEIEVVGEADDGKQAIALCLERKPDVITLDMVLPVMSGLAATEYIMAHCPTPILIVSASTNRGELFKTYEALAAGAVDVFDKPAITDSDEAWAKRLIDVVKMVARIKVIRRMSARRSTPPFVTTEGAPGPRRAAMVALGASTGGPGALVEVLRALPTGFRFPVLIVLHIGEPFGSSFADWLDGVIPHPVTFARGGELVSAHVGRVVMAPPGKHMTVRGGRVHLDSSAPRHSCRPSIDTLFESLAVEYGSTCAAALLTGMGRDGAAGLLAVRTAGGFTIAQDQASSIVYGMPREAAKLNAADRILSLRAIGPALAALLPYDTVKML